MKKIFPQIAFGDKGFTLIEILVVIAILGVLVAIVVPNVAKFANAGEREAQDTELHDIRAAVTAMLADCELEKLDAAQNDIADMDLVTANSGAVVLSDYLTGLDADGKVKTDCTYDFSIDGGVIQKIP